MMGVQDRFGEKYGDRIAYLDLFAGPGRYDDGTNSTPLMILENAIAQKKLRNRLVTIFNDKNENNTRSLQQAIDSNRISMGLPNELVEERMNALFGVERANALRAKIEGLSSSERELTIVEELGQE